VENHPKLAQVIDEQILVESAAESLVDDPEYKEAMDAAAEAGAGAEIIASVVQRLVGRFLRGLV
jgi:hypothetical protein